MIYISKRWSLNLIGGVILLATGYRDMLQLNFWVEDGLVNWSPGTAKDIVFGPHSLPPSLLVILYLSYILVIVILRNLICRGLISVLFAFSNCSCSLTTNR